MPLSDFLSVFQWWSTFLIIGLLFYPITSLFFYGFIDKGYIFSKVLGIIFISYIIYLLGTLHLASFTQFNNILLAFCTFLFSIIPILRKKDRLLSSFINSRQLVFIVIEEALFFLAILFWSYIRGFQPDIHGLEKYMDYGFVNAILQTNYFPAKDMWFTPFSINYYYFGHIITAVLTNLSFLPSFISYNLMIATLFAFSLTCTFSIAINLLANHLENKIKKLNKYFTIFKPISIISGGVISGILLSLGGNLHTIYLFFSPYKNEHVQPFWELAIKFNEFPNAYWYPNATRFIYNTIHEFPLYSFVVSDLHGHVLGIPVVLTIIAFLFHEYSNKNNLSKKSTLFISFLVSIAYMINALDGPIYLLLCSLTILFILFKKQKISITIFFKLYFKKFCISIVILLLGFVIFSLPFSYYFKPFVSGIGILCAPEVLSKIGKIGPFLFEANHCQKSPIWQLFILYGFFYIWISIFLLSMWKNKNRTSSDIFVLLLVLISTILIILPEFIYFKDIYPAHYRANTMFKFGYQAFMMLSICAGYCIFRTIHSLKITLLPFLFIGIYAMCLVLIYPFFAISSYYNNLLVYKGLNGISYLKDIYPDDYSAIIWMKENISGQPVVLEAQGDSYTDFARVSTHTGIPTVLGWTVHEWLWRGSYDIPAPRIADIQVLYESHDMKKTQELIKKYNVSYIFIGDLEKQKYPNLYENKFMNLGYTVYSKNNTKIYKVR